MKHSWYPINIFERWMLKRIARRICIQSYVHEQNVIEYYKIMNTECTKQFYEDSPLELKVFLTECHTESL